MSFTYRNGNLFTPSIHEGVATLRIPAALTTFEPPLICRAFRHSGWTGIFSAVFIGQTVALGGNVDSN